MKWVEKTKTTFEEARLLIKRQQIHFSDYTENRTRSQYRRAEKFSGSLSTKVIPKCGYEKILRTAVQQQR